MGDVHHECVVVGRVLLSNDFNAGFLLLVFRRLLLLHVSEELELVVDQVTAKGLPHLGLFC